MKTVLKGIGLVGLVLYPFIVGYGLSQGYMFWVAVFLMIMGGLRWVSGGKNLMWPLTLFAILCGGLSLLFKDQAWLKLYPVMMSLGACGIFGMTLFKPPSMIERFARLVEPELPQDGVIWTRKITQIWCVFFALNALIALYTVYFASTQIWVIYNGFISYVLMGILLLGEYLLRKRQQRLNQMPY